MNDPQPLPICTRDGRLSPTFVYTHSSPLASTPRMSARPSLFQSPAVTCLNDCQPDPICTGADGDYIQWWREARDKHGYTATGLNADPEIGAWATYYMARILLDNDDEPKDWYAPSVVTNNENLDQYADVTGERIPVQIFKFDQIPGVFTRTEKLPG